MGNPVPRHPAIVITGPVPLDAEPSGVLGVRSCSICSRCLELGVYGGRSWWAECAWQGRWEFPDEGCVRFAFDLAGLGEEGAADLVG